MRRRAPSTVAVPLYASLCAPGPAALLAAALLFALPAAAQASLPEPVDPLKRPEVTPGRLSVNVSLNYAPASGALFDVDPGGNPYTDTYAVHTLTPGLSLKYALSERLSIGGGLSLRYRVEQTLRRYGDGRERYIEAGSLSLQPRASLAYRLDPAGAYDPTVALTLYRPWAADVSLSASLIRDPVVLSSSLTLAHSFMPPFASSFNLSAGMGFVANDRVSFGLNAGLTQPFRFAAPPSLSLNFSTSYGLDPEGKGQLTLNLSARAHGGALGYGVGLGYGLRELDPGARLAAVLGR